MNFLFELSIFKENRKNIWSLIYIQVFIFLDSNIKKEAMYIIQDKGRKCCTSTAGEGHKSEKKPPAKF